MAIMSASKFVDELNDHQSPLVARNCTIKCRFASSRYTTAPNRSMLFVNFYNLPIPRSEQNRGGGAEAENNRMSFIISGFGEDIEDRVETVRVENRINVFSLKGIKALRAKSGDPYKIAVYLADYINDVAAKIAPNFTHG